MTGHGTQRYIDSILEIRLLAVCGGFWEVAVLFLGHF